MATTSDMSIGLTKGIPQHIVARLRASGMKLTKKPLNTIGELVKVKIPGAGNSKHSKKNKKTSQNNNNFGIAIQGPGHKKPAPSPHTDALFANDDNGLATIGGQTPANDNNFIMVPKNPTNGSSANNIMSHSMNAGVALDNTWTVLFAHDVVIPIGNPMAPVLALSHDITKPIASSGAANPVARQGTDVFNSPLDAAPLNIQELVRQKAKELMQKNNINLEYLFMDRP